MNSSAKKMYLPAEGDAAPLNDPSIAKRITTLNAEYRGWFERAQKIRANGRSFIDDDLIRIFAAMTVFKAEHDRRPIYCWTKSLFDRIGATLLLAIFSPLFLLIAIAIKLDSPGPVFFKQLRVGKLGHIFWIYKFRTMFEGSENLRSLAVAPVDKIAGDQRSTRIGRFLRTHKFDELPQLLNIVFGHMSLVGPRPLIVEESATTPLEFQIRFAVIPGLTGLWQATVPNFAPGSQRLALDAEYVRRRCWRLDISLLLRTLPVFIKGEGKR